MKEVRLIEDKMYGFIYMTFIQEQAKWIYANRNQISGRMGQEVG